ncbi:SSI family serine proteinase inhibitor [Streptomyces sp. NPDC056580]|uniref:SSI family serine proteinase inhibitor n=1 Tax=Streptomyces sp. NPDC056580 TaxID=3345872 RepID=UPI003687E932
MVSFLSVVPRGVLVSALAALSVPSLSALTAAPATGAPPASAAPATSAALAASIAPAASAGPAATAGGTRLVPAPRAAGLMPPPARPEDKAGDHLRVVVRNAGPRLDGTYELSCHPTAGDHPDAAGACRALDANTQWGRDTFAPVAPDSVCTMLYGGPATARVTGTWAGRPVDAAYDRGNGCEIARWDRMVPLLPGLGPTA